MARKIKVATLSGEVLTTPLEEGMEAAVTKMISYWERRLSLVLPDHPDLIVLPECCDRYSSFDTKNPHFDPKLTYEYYESYRGTRILDYFASVAKKHRCYIAYSAIMPDTDGINRNSVMMIDRNGQVIGRYNKHNLTIGEVDNIKGLCGKDAAIFDCDFGKVGAVICFDLNFEEIRNLYKEKCPDLLIFSSAYHGSFMQNFWAYELQSWMVTAIGCNDISSVINPVGTRIAETCNYRNYITCDINLDCKVAHLDLNWEATEKAKNKYGADFVIHDPGHLGAMLLTSESEDVTVTEIMDEFGIETLDSYFERSIRCADEHREK